MKKYWITGGVLALGAVLVWWLYALPPVPDGLRIPDSAEAVARGEYLVIAGGCLSCHRGPADGESGEALSGGLGIDTPFGTFYAPNITPHLQTGIGAWEAADFILAMKHGRSPDGGFYYPAFPYRAYAGLTDEDVLDIAAYLLSLPPLLNTAPPLDTPFWLQRWLMAGWNLLADWRHPDFADYVDYAEGSDGADSTDSAEPSTAPQQVARGAYLARHLAHCGECHTPRNFLGLPIHSREFAGARLGDEIIEAIDAEHLADWSADAFALFLLIGIKPDGDFVGGDMNEVIEHNTSRLTESDRQALATFFTRPGR